MDQFLEKMLGQALRQYGRNIATDPLSPYEKQSLKAALKERQNEEPEEDLHAHIEDVIYDYVTNQGLFS
ncbi:YqzH family protein [Bacillus atrophaeus]|uniref:YqzH family protein n=1 Tax=Bacillus atrophaeus TaxID=1452 RepID=UPI003ED888FA